ncbi:uncharacterized protein LOC143990256 [Lithobates pipiens]
MYPFKDQEFLGEFLDKYRDMRNLWEVKNPLYHNKAARKATLEKLLESVKTRAPNADMRSLETKIGSLRSTYRKEYQKVQQSLRSGAAADKVYVPSLWYFNRMHFLDDQIEARESLSTLLAPLPSSLPSSLPSTPAEASVDQPGPSNQEEIEEPSWSQEDLSHDEALASGTQEEVAGPSNTQSQVPPLVLPYKRPRKGTKTEEAALALIKEANNALKSPLDAVEAYGIYIASNLQQMEEGQRHKCEKLNFTTIHKGLSGKITDDDHLCALPHPTPSATGPPPEPPGKAVRKAAGKTAGKAVRKTRK